jgi:ribosomal protein L17
MAGGAAKYRHLSRSSSHRQALLRNLVTSLIKHESITTTWAKAKEAQRLAEKVITLGKKNTEASKRRALEIFYVCVTRHPFSVFEAPGSDTPQLSLSLSPLGYDIGKKKKKKKSRRSLLTHLDSPRAPSKTLWQPPRALRRPSWRIHSRPPD